MGVGRLLYSARIRKKGKQFNFKCVLAKNEVPGRTCQPRERSRKEATQPPPSVHRRRPYWPGRSSREAMKPPWRPAEDLAGWADAARRPHSCPVCQWRPWWPGRNGKEALRTPVCWCGPSRPGRSRKEAASTSLIFINFQHQKDEIHWWKRYILVST